MSTPFLPHIPAFFAVMHHGSLSAAARHLRQSQPTVRRHVEAMEESLGVSLFTRSANGLTPTAMAESLLPFATSVLEQSAALQRAATAEADQIHGVVRITTSRIVATHIMPLVLSDLTQKAPNLRFELAATDLSENLAGRAADIALRFTPPSQQALIAQKMPDVEVGFFAAKGHPKLTDPAQLAEAAFIADDRENTLLPLLVESGLPPLKNLVLRCDDPLAQLAHVQAGMGIGVCQVKLAARLGLQRVLPQIRYPMPCWLVMHEDQSSVPRIRAVFDHLKAKLPDWI